MDTDTTNPVDGGDTSELDTAANDTGVDAEDQQGDAEPELDADGNPIDADEDEEVDLDDLKLKVPKSQAQKVREGILRQADYTRKTQEVAEEKRAVQTERQMLHQSSQAELDAYARATQLGAQLAQYEQVDWRTWHDTDPFAASAANSEFNMLDRAHKQALGQLQNLRNQRTFQQQQDTAKRMEEGAATLTKDIPGWSPDLKAKLIGFAAGYGFSRDELSDLEADPRVAKVLHAAFKGTEATRRQQTAANIAKGPEAAPATVLKGTSGRAPVNAATKDFAAFEKLAANALK